jgi:hypothetical protein
MSLVFDAMFWVDESIALRLAIEGIGGTQQSSLTGGFQKAAGLVRYASLASDLVLGMSELRADSAWHESARTLEAALLDMDPESVSQGWLSRIPYENSFGGVGLFRHYPYLRNDFVYDAHAVQVLSGRHLERASDLSAWVTSSIGDGRYLVRARDVGPWFAELPTSEVLASARHDFGDMILTTELASSLGLDPREQE